MSGLALVALLLLAPALPGVATRTTALLTARRGAPVWQLYADLWKLARKGQVLSSTTTWVFRAAPALGVAALVTAALFVPIDGHASVVAFPGDLVVFTALFAMRRFALVLAALDTGSSFEGMGASRELLIGAFTEPALFLCFVALVLATHDLSLAGLLGAPLAGAWTGAAPSLAMIGAGFFVLLLAECARVPVDDPATHLELTMVHEVMVLDHSGPDLALNQYAGALALAILSALVVSVVVPRGALPPVASTVVLIAGTVVVAAIAGAVGAVMARLRLVRVPQLLVIASALAILGITLLVH